MKDPADAYTLELPLLGDVALPDWLRPALRTCPCEGAAFGARLDILQDLPRDAPLADFMLAYGRMLEARDRLYDAWTESEPDDEEDPFDLELERLDDAEEDAD